MNVLHLALNASGQQHALIRLLKSFGTYREIDWHGHWKRGNLRELHQIILSEVRTHPPDLTFMQLQTADVLTPEVCKAIPGFKINWTGDVRQPTPKWYYDLAPHVSVTCFTNCFDVFQLTNAGHRAAYLQIGYDENIYRPDGSKGNWPEIVFMGADYKTLFPQSRERRQMVEHLKQRYGKRFAAYGNGFEKPLNQQQEAECYRSCKVAISQSNFLLERYSSDRLLRILGSGAFCLCREYPGIGKDWATGVQLATWNNLIDLSNQIDFWLKPENEVKRREIAGCGHQKALTENTWTARKDAIEDLMHTFGNTPAPVKSASVKTCPHCGFALEGAQ